MTVWTISQNLDVSINLVNILKGFKNISCDEEADKYGCDGRVAFDLMFVELHHYLMDMEHGLYNYNSLVHRRRTQISPPHNPSLTQLIKNLPQMVV